MQTAKHNIMINNLKKKPNKQKLVQFITECSPMNFTLTLVP